LLGNDDTSTTESARQETMVIAGTVSALRIRLSANVGTSGDAATDNYKFTVRKNGADTAVTCTITGASNNCSDTTNSVAFAAGDNFSISADPTGTPANDLDVSWYVRY
jgi:hypothetical protein